MRWIQLGVSVVLFLSALGAQADEARQAPLFEGLGSHQHTITTRSPEAQRYFDQGLILSYGFNHAEAERSFREAARLDPECAMCNWGVALVLGPNINAQMEPEAAPKAYAALQRAQQLAPGASTAEQAYVAALAKRYVEDPPENRKPLDVAYAEAMRDLARRHPDDLDAQTLFAEALMDVNPWDYWAPDGNPRPWTPELLHTLEGVLRKQPNHAGAIHFYIHAVEASDSPQRAERYADKLAALTPGAGHLVHMPAHIYMRVGRYHDASLANLRAVEADDSYVTQCHAQGLYPLAYVPHNWHFLWASASMEGWSEQAIRAAHETDHKTDHERMRDDGLGTLQHYTLTPLFAYVRFGRWEKILAMPAPPADLLYPTAMWHYARGRALTATDKLDAAAKELAALQTIAQNDSLEKITIWDINDAPSVLAIASEMLAGELAAKRGDRTNAITHLRAAVRLEDALNYNEPPDWDYPARHSLGALLLEDGKAAEAETVYRRDLRENRENGWALFGLHESLKAQGKSAQAKEASARFEKAWSGADITLTSSRF